MSEALHVGERNFNPFNMEGFKDEEGEWKWTDWQGLAEEQTDMPYLQFVDIEHGLRAGYKNLHNQWRMHHLNTVATIIEKYAPPVENNTQAYINAVCVSMRVHPSAVLNMDDNNILFWFGKAIIEHEEGRCLYTDEQLHAAVEEVLG